MSQFVPLCLVTETPQEGEVCEIAAAGRVFCIARVNGEVIVMDNVCPHRGGPLGQGVIDGGRLVCPWHAWAFDVKTGCSSNDRKTCAHIFTTHVEGGVVMVELE